MAGVAVFVGLDVSKTNIQMAVRPSGEAWSSPVNDTGIQATAEKLQTIHPDIVVMEAHGGPELSLAGTLASAGLPFAMISPKSIKEFARAIGGTREDRNQAGLLAHYAELVRPEVRKVSPELVNHLKILRSRRLDVLSMLALEQRRLDVAANSVQKDLRNHIHFLERSVVLIDEEISRSVRAHGRLMTSA